MYRYDNERRLKIGGIVTTVKFISLVILGIALFIEISNISVPNFTFGHFSLSQNELQATLSCISIFVLFTASILLVRYYQNRFVKSIYGTNKRIIYDIIEILIFILLYTMLILTSGMHQSPFKIIYMFIMISVTIQHGLKYGLIVSSVCSSIVLAIDLISFPSRPNEYFQIDFILSGVYIMTTWLVGYYRRVEEEYGNKMANLAILDDLTGLYSHGFFQDFLSDSFNMSKKYGKPISLLFIDIDFFKYFNDLYGHQAGDDVLKDISHLIRRHIQDSYIAARYGGEEFTILMPDTSEEEAVLFAEKIRDAVEKEFANRFKEISKITVSIGVSCYPTKAKSKDELIKYADDALYRAKSFHKNRVETYQSVFEELKNDIEDNDIEIVSSVKTLISIINSKDRYTYSHVERVVIYCGLIADELKLNNYEKKILKYGAYLHDIGKINIPKEILIKKMDLTNEEWELVKQHPSDGAEIIIPVKSLADVIPIILHHHERYDGYGYPMQLSGEEIPYLARILTVADCFDAITSNRPYKVARSFDEAIYELKSCANTQFDPQIVKAFVEIIDNKRNIF